MLLAPWDHAPSEGGALVPKGPGLAGSLTLWSGRVRAVYV